MIERVNKTFIVVFTKLEVIKKQNVGYKWVCNVGYKWVCLPLPITFVANFGPKSSHN